MKNLFISLIILATIFLLGCEKEYRCYHYKTVHVLTEIATGVQYAVNDTAVQDIQAYGQDEADTKFEQMYTNTPSNGITELEWVILDKWVSDEC